MPAVKRQRRSSLRNDTKRARTRQGGRSDGSSYAVSRSSLHPWRYLKDLLSLCTNNSILPLDALSRPLRSLSRLLEVPQRWMLLLGGTSAEECELPAWCATQDITFEILEYLDPGSLARLSATCKALRPSVRTYALHVVRQRYADIPVGFASHAISVGMLSQCPHFGALPILSDLAPHLTRQRMFQPRCDSLETVQADILGRGYHITRHMRTVLVDWMIEVASEYRLAPVCLHAAVNLMDRCLSRFATPRHRLQLLGVCCLMIESQRASGYAMTINDVCYISDSQYNEFEVVAMYNIVTGNTQEAVAEQSAETVQDFLTFFLHRMDLPSMAGPEAPAIGDIAEDVVLCNLLADLSLLDYHMLRFHPSTIATSILLFSRLLLHHFSHTKLSITSMGVLSKAPREVLALCHYRRPYVDKNPAYEQQPFGLSSLGLFVHSYEAEALACALCVSQLWRLHCDFLFHTSGIGNEPHILRAHNYMLKGITDKYCPADSDRAVAWRTIGNLHEKHVLDWVRTHLRVTLPDSGRLPRV